MTNERCRPVARKRRVVVEVYRRDDTGRVLPRGRLVTEYGRDRRGGSIVDADDKRAGSCER